MRDYSSYGNLMIMTSLETMTDTITSSNISNLTAIACHNQITFKNGRRRCDILRKHVIIISLLPKSKVADKKGWFVEFLIYINFLFKR